MKRLNFVALGLLLVFVFGFSVGCSKTDYAENEHIITIYKKEYSLNEEGKIQDDGYTLWKTFGVLNTQMYDLPNAKDEKYFYLESISGQKFVSEDKVQMLPSKSETLFVREREKKTINFYLDGVNVKTRLKSDNLEYYNKNFVDTYKEGLHYNVGTTYIWEDLLDISFMTGDVFKCTLNNKSFVVVELYADAEYKNLYDTVCLSQGNYACEGETSYRKDTTISAIKSMDFYMKIVKTLEYEY
ncbi:MAG: hypothetical protein IKA11_04525 [Clostridia bacterium]|nr:hypothetical protein [Clostridia bacterium]